MKLLLVDNFDSFTYNLLHYFSIGGASVQVLRNDALQHVNPEAFHAFVLSPGPGRPENAGGLMDFVHEHLGKKPMLGICLGMQAIGLHYGWTLSPSPIPVHGKARDMEHSGRGIFQSLPSPLSVGRYHSLRLEVPENPGGLQIDAVSGREIMAVSDEKNRAWGLQFHPESILTPYGQQMINAWLKMLG